MEKKNEIRVEIYTANLELPCRSKSILFYF